MQKKLVIVFAKNKLYGKVKTRLAKSIGDESAFKVYERLYQITETQSMAVNDADVWVYYSHKIDYDSWKGCPRFVQEGENLGDRMKTAFRQGFASGFDHIIGIGADLPEISSTIIEEGFAHLNQHDFVFGPAEDGGYYLVGLSQPEGMHVFENKSWSTQNLMAETKAEITSKGKSIYLMHTLNDIDNVEDLERSCIASDFVAEIATGKA